MFRRQFRVAFSFLAAFVLALALAASSASANESRNISTNMDILTPTSLGGKPVKSGTYKVVADGSTVTLKQGKKVIAEAPAKWKEAAIKASYSSVVTDGNGIKEFHFEGKMSYVEVE